MPATKIDPRKELGSVYAPKRAPQIVEVPALTFLMVDGHGDPNTAKDYVDAIGALFTLSYGAKFAIKEGGGPDYRVMPLESLWGGNGGVFPERMEDWTWTAMIAQPPEVTPELIASLRERAERKVAPEVLDRVRIETFEEGPAAQVLNIGPWSQEEATIKELHDFIADHQLAPRGRHHEIYLSDPQRTAPERLRTIIRQPVGPADACPS